MSEQNHFKIIKQNTMTNKFYTCTEIQMYNGKEYSITVDFYDRMNENGEYEIKKVTGDTLAVSLFVAEKLGAPFHRKQLNLRLKAFIEAADLAELPKKGRSNAI